MTPPPPSVPGEPTALRLATVPHLNVVERFGPTIQGEGRHAGRLAAFLRLGGCNLSCSWCDTPFSWDWDRYDHRAEVTRTPAAELADWADQLPGQARLVVSGGEPLLQSPTLAHLLGLLAVPRPVDIETNGTRPLGLAGPLLAELGGTVTTSPKVGPSAGLDPTTTRLHPDIIEVADFKFVVADEADLMAAVQCVRDHGVPPDRVWIMPEGVTADRLTTLTPYVMEAAVAHGFNFTSRLHVYGWGTQRGH